MTLNIRIVSCLVCSADCAAARDEVKLDRLDENGGRDVSSYVYALPPARYRDRIAPDVCDWCWSKHRAVEINRWSRSRSYFCRPFRGIYLWDWVQGELAKEAEVLGREARRLAPHFAEKAGQGQGVILKGPARQYGARKVVYRRMHA